MTLFSRRAFGGLAAVTSLALTLSGPSLAQSPSMIEDAGQLVQSLRSGGYIIVVRHGATFSNQADTDPFNLDNIAKQRNLNDKGKALAKAFGDAIRQVGIPVGEVYTSKFNRAYETAVLAGFKDIEKFYMELAHQTMPVIEVSAAKPVTLVISEGVNLEIKKLRKGGVK